MSALKWVKELPPIVNPRNATARTDVTVLDTRPGVWAVLKKYPKITTANNTAARLRVRHPGYEFASRKNGAGGIVYARKIKK